MRRPLPGEPGLRPRAALQPALQPFEGEAVFLRYHELAIAFRIGRQPRGRRRDLRPADVMSVPRRERNTTRPSPYAAIWAR